MPDSVSPEPRYNPQFPRKTSAEMPAEISVDKLDAEITNHNKQINDIKEQWKLEANQALASLGKMQCQQSAKVTEHQNALVYCYYHRACLSGPPSSGNRGAGLCAPENQTVLYSGRALNDSDKSTQSIHVADDYAKENGKTTINMTAGGTWLNRQELWGADSNLTSAQASAVWDLASGEFVRQSRGDVVFIEGPNPHPQSTTKRIEVPELMAEMQRDPDRKVHTIKSGERFADEPGMPKPFTGEMTPRKPDDMATVLVQARIRGAIFAPEDSSKEAPTANQEVTTDDKLSFTPVEEPVVTRKPSPSIS